MKENWSSTIQDYYWQQNIERYVYRNEVVYLFYSFPL